MSLADAIAKVLAEDLNSQEDVSEAEAIPLNLTISDSSAQEAHQQVMEETDDPPKAMKGADICPECGMVAFVSEDGCDKCYSCGFSKC